ncbi:YceI family protein [Salinicoccus carnicancri]|uniref:YceI family protein n=1 Tax=Salinicoccus carnicancri TaxID=558170 RepID=UPI000310D4CD|nr:YceI family protein [Salinicoccus carnicancri]
MTIYVSDAVHSEVEFQVKHMMVSKVKGSFEEFNFEVETDNLETFEDAKVTAEIETASINTGNADRDGHLKSDDFFDTENNPQITFTSKQVEKSGDTVKVTGDVTIAGVTKEKTFELTYNGKGISPMGGQEVHGFETAFTINREEFGLTWNAQLETGGVLVSRDVKVQLELQFSEKQEG